MYKFEIHRNPNISTDGKFVDQDRYDSSGYVYERTINPIWDELAFEWKKGGERAFFRKNISGNFTLIDADFDWANSIRTSAEERNKYRILIISEKQDGVWTEVWRGFFSIIVGEWNLSKCFVVFSDLIVWDRYTKYIENIEEERNFIDISPYPITYEISNYDFETKSVVLATDTTILAAPCAFTLPAISTDDYFIDEADNIKYTLYQRRINATVLGATVVWNVTGYYRRDTVCQVDNPGSGWVSLGVCPPDSGNETLKWVRNYLGLSSPTYHNYTSIVFVPNASAPGEYISCEVVNDDIVESLAPGFEDYDNERARDFWAVMNYAIHGSTYPFATRSEFLSNATNPVTGDANEVNLMFVIQFSDLQDTSDPATKALYSFVDLEAWLLMLNLYWIVDDDGIVRIEHEKYFDYGLSYTAPTDPFDGLDVSNNIEAKNTSVFSFKSKSIPRIQELKMFYESGDDFYGTPILYTGSMANWGDENKFTRSTSNMATDLRGAVLNENVGKDGFMLVATSYEGGGAYSVISGAGALTGGIIANSPLSVANIEDKFYRWGGLASIGVMNKTFITFDSTKNNFEQETFSIAYCGSDFNPYKLVRTEYGDGKVESAVLALKDKKLTLTLSYGA